MYVCLVPLLLTPSDATSTHTKIRSCMCEWYSSRPTIWFSLQSPAIRVMHNYTIIWGSFLTSPWKAICYHLCNIASSKWVHWWESYWPEMHKHMRHHYNEIFLHFSNWGYKMWFVLISKRFKLEKRAWWHLIRNSM